MQHFEQLRGHGFFCVLILLVTFALGLSGVQADDVEFLKRRLVLLVEEGEMISLVPPEAPTGTSGPISRVNSGPIGSFETGTLSGEPLGPSIVEVLTTGSAIAGPIGGTFSLPRGQIEDEHTAWFTLSPEEPRFAAEFGLAPEDVAVVIITAEGEITGGTGRFRNAMGTSKLYLKIEAPKDLSALPIARTGLFLFEFDNEDKQGY